MIKTVSKNTDAQGLDYETLRLEGIRLIQKLCENVWTDFNPHDPGVTILEQIVYALTDLGYKANFDITTFLSDQQGQINYKRQALYTREEVSLQFPVTIEDYERFFERELDCERVDFKVTEPGLYSVQLWPQDSSMETKESLIGRFTALWREWRNLGERVTQISVEKSEGDLIRHVYEIPFEIDCHDSQKLPTGAPCDFIDFSPIIEQFPSIYRYGTGANELKKYLEPIEHLFKLFLLAMQDFAEMFSVYSLKTDFHHYNRILNQMLAMYGVQYPDALFLQMRENKHNNVENSIAFRSLLHSKINYLRHLPELHMHRCGKWWKQRIEMMLGLEKQSHHSMHIYVIDGIFLKDGFGKVFVVWSAETPFTNTQEKRDDIERFIRDELPAHLVPVFYWVPHRSMHTFNLFAHSPAALEKWFKFHEKFISGALWL